MLSNRIDVNFRPFSAVIFALIFDGDLADDRRVGNASLCAFAVASYRKSQEDKRLFAFVEHVVEQYFGIYRQDASSVRQA